MQTTLRIHDQAAGNACAAGLEPPQVVRRSVVVGPVKGKRPFFALPARLLGFHGGIGQK